jgi:hypothetical protein
MKRKKRGEEAGIRRQTGQEADRNKALRKKGFRREMGWNGWTDGRARPPRDRVENERGNGGFNDL